MCAWVCVCACINHRLGDLGITLYGVWAVASRAVEWKGTKNSRKPVVVGAYSIYSHCLLGPTGRPTLDGRRHYSSSSNSLEWERKRRSYHSAGYAVAAWGVSILDYGCCCCRMLCPPFLLPSFFLFFLPLCGSDLYLLYIAAAVCKRERGIDCCCCCSWSDQKKWRDDG